MFRISRNEASRDQANRDQASRDGRHVEAERVRTRQQRRAVRRACEGGQMLESLEERKLMAADPITKSHPVFFAVYGAPVMDGVVNQAEWASAPAVVRAQGNQYGSQVTIRYMYNERGLFIATDAKDDRVWADGNGGGVGNKWEFAEDDGMGFYFDPTNSRSRYLGPTGRFLGYNLGARMGKLAGAGKVTRYDYLAGNGVGWGGNVNPGGALHPGIRWQNRVWGTLNNNSDADQGWSSELFLPWAAIGMTAMPVNGQFIGTNFQMFFDNTGGTRDSVTNEFSSDVNVRFGPRINDDEIQGVHSSYSYTWSGFEGPINYAQLTFVNQYQSDTPRGALNLTTVGTTGYATKLNFVAPRASQLYGGSVQSYQIRYSTSPITDETGWGSATAVVNTFVPKPGGQGESLRIGGLSPSTTYYVAVRGVDAAGRVGNIATTTFTTQSTDQDTSGGERVMVSPAGGHLIKESGEAFVMMGTHSVINSPYMHNLYNAPVWNGNKFRNYYQYPGPEGDAGGYFDALSTYGINTIRVNLDWIALANTTQARSQLPNGAYWFESSPGQYNPAMRDFVHNVMDLAHQYGIKIIFDPFNTFNFRSYFELTPFSTVNGGPITNMDEFFYNPTVFSMSVNRMKTLIDWINDNPHRETVIGIEPVNEWDAMTDEQVSRPEVDRMLEARTRARFMVRLSNQVRAYDPTMLLMHTGDEVIPRGPVARAVFTSDAFDALNPHYYTRTTSEPVNIPGSDKSILPAIDYAGITQYWTSNRRDNRPLQNGEWALTATNWSTNRPYYTGVSPVSDPNKPWTVAMDTDLFRTTGWASIASGMSGPGLRIGGVEMRDLVPAGLNFEEHGFLPLPYPVQMREIQASMNDFITNPSLSIDWAKFKGSSLAGRMSFNSATGLHMSRTLYNFGISDGLQGVVYVMENQAISTATVSGMSLTIDGVAASSGTNPWDTNYSVEVWSAGADAHVLSRLDDLTTTYDARLGNRLTIALPSFDRDVVIKFKRV